MIVGSYLMHLYCDASTHERLPHASKPEFSRRNEFGQQQTAAGARQAARKAGWKLDLEAGTAVCPACVTLERSH